MEAPAYRNRSIGSLKSLARHLSIPPEKLVWLANQAEEFYSPPSKPTFKSNGEIREIYRVDNPLALIQQRIKEQILHKCAYPNYLQGSVPNQGTRRDYITNANLHTKKQVILGEDISDFFSSIRASDVERMWQHLFHFPQNIARILTKLTTYHGHVPQGASTSSFIGNLIFWDKEPQFVEDLKRRGFQYSRYVDDITISAERYVSPKELQAITSTLYAMLSSKGVRPNRKKRSLQSNSGPMTVHKLPLNSGRPTLGRRKWSKLRAEVKQIEDMARDKRASKEYETKYQSLYGKLGAMARIEPQKAKPYMDRLRLVEPEK
jgi:hypothetical protein